VGEILLGESVNIKELRQDSFLLNKVLSGHTKGK